MKKRKILLLILLLALSLTACKSKSDKELARDDKLVEDRELEENLEEVEEETKPSKEDIDLSLRPNEAGQLMVLMYHNVGEEEAEWTRTYENFRRDLETLYEKGYRAVSLEDYVKNQMDVEAGKTPVVITFDDGNENNFRLIEEDGRLEIDPKSAVGILENFKKDYPDFNTTASFFLFGSNPFRQEEYIEYKLNYLIDNGYSIGNHTLDHRSLRNAENKEYIEEAIGKQLSILKDLAPKAQVNTYAICYGERPKDPELVPYLEKGNYQGTAYENIAILNVGWNPAKSPIDKDFDPLSIPRIRASEMKVDNVGIYNWLEYFDNNPDKRYVSDGFLEIVTLPKELEDTIDKEKLGDLELYLYEN